METQDTVEFKKEISRLLNFDIVVVGGGPSGLAAALAAARKGKEVLILEKTGCLGGMGTSGLVPTFAPLDDGKRILAQGIAEEVVQRLEERGGVSERLRDGRLLNDKDESSWLWIQYNHEKLKKLYDDMVEEVGIEVRFSSQFLDVEMYNSEINRLIVLGKEDLFAIKAKSVIDATGDAVIAKKAGSDCVVGGENQEFQAPTLPAIFANVNWHKYEEFLEETNQTHSLDKTLREAIEAGAFEKKDYHLPGVRKIGRNLVGVNAGHIYNLHPLKTKGITEAMKEGRRLAQEYLDFYRNYVPGFEGADLISTAPLLGVRESRRIIGEYVLNVKDFKNRSSFKDEIGRYNYPIDIHRSEPGLQDHEDFEEEFFESYRYGKGESYGIPFRSLVPKKIDNLLVTGRSISTDRKMQGSTRVMPCAFITGQAAGIAVSLGLDENVKPDSVPIDKLKKKLRGFGAYIPS